MINTTIFSVNDIHGKAVNMERVVSAAYEVDSRYNKKDNDLLNLSSGDIAIGESVETNKTAVMFQNIIKTNASVLGNHEYDIQDKIGEILEKVKYDLIASNIRIHPRNPLSKNVKSSVVKEINGHKYGIIGATPIDLYKRSKQGMVQRDIFVDDPQQTLNDIQYEADKLKSQGINKIILLSHLGNYLDKLVAQNTSGIDVIQGGHTHETIFDVKEGVNLFYNKDGEPVIITQAGRDGNNFGVLNLQFDQNGVIRKVQNNTGYTKNFGRNLPAKYVFDKIFGNNKIYGVIASSSDAPKSLLIGRNPHAYFIADCMKNAVGGDIALIQGGNIRGHFEQGEQDTRAICDILPFKNKIWKVNLSEKDIVDAIKYGAKSVKDEANKPGMLYASGLKYSVCPEGEVVSMSFVDKNGKETPIDVNNPRQDKFYTTVIYDYLGEGNDKFSMLNRPQQIVQKYDFDAAVCVQKVLEKSKQPIIIKDDNRLEFIANVNSTLGKN